MGKIDKRISIVINMSEEQLREVIQEEIKKALNEALEAEAEKAMDTLKTLPVTLGNPSAASRIPAVPFPEIPAEDVRKRIEELVDEDLRERLTESEAEATRAAEVILDLEVVIRRLEAEKAGLRKRLLTMMHLARKYDLEQFAPLGWGQFDERVKELKGEADDNGEDARKI